VIRSARLGRSLGLLLAWIGQLQYVSYSSRVVFDRWSVFAFAAICLVGVACLASSVRSIQILARSGQPEPSPDSAPADSEWAPAVDLGVLLWGAAYLLSALDDPEAGGRILELDLFGSQYPPAVGLDWLSMLSLAWAAALFAWSRWRGRHPQRVALAISLGFVLLLGEGLARIWSVTWPATQGFPTASDQLWLRRHVETNREGFRDREHELAKPSGTRRVVVIGDSYTFGVGIERPEDRLSDLLAASVGGPDLGRVEVLNAGLPYSHTLQHIEFLERTLAYAPDLVLLLYVFNDIEYLQSGTRPTAVTGSPASIVDRLNPMRALFKNSYLYQQLYLRFRHLYWRFSPGAVLPPDPYESPEVLSRHLLDLARFVDVARSAGAAARIVPFNLKVLLPGDRERIEAFIQRMLAADLPVWPAADAFQGAAYDELIVNAMDHHPNERANRALAAALLPLVREALADQQRREAR
jgi:hypothetical protein